MYTLIGMFKILFSLCIFISSNNAFAALSCSELISKSGTTADPIKLAQDTADLFKAAELELKIYLATNHHRKQVIDANLAQKLHDLLNKLTFLDSKEIPESFISVGRELVSVLDGSLGVKDYSRRSEVGYDNSVQVPKTPKSSQKSVVWSKINDGTAYIKLKGSFFLASSALINFPDISLNGPLEKRDALLGLLENRIGAGLRSKDPKRTTSGEIAFNFSFLAFYPGTNNVAKVSGFQLINKESKEAKTVVTHAEAVSLKTEVEYYKQAARQTNIDELEVPLLRRLEGKGSIVAPPRILYKLQHKHDVTPEEVSSLLRSIDPQELNPLDFNKKFLATYKRTENGALLFIVIGRDPTNIDRWMLKTIYPVESQENHLIESITEG